jgi:hypothetical protein
MRAAVEVAAVELEAVARGLADRPGQQLVERQVNPGDRVVLEQHRGLDVVGRTRAQMHRRGVADADGDRQQRYPQHRRQYHAALSVALEFAGPYSH